MSAAGEVLLELAASSRREFVLCAPFAKKSAVARVLAEVPSTANILLYTRWRPDEIAAGVSDTEVLEVLQSRGGTVFLHDRLHAKFFRNEHSVLLGSANLTGKALGWAPEPNLELLVPTSLEAIAEFESVLLSESIRATADRASEVEALASLLPAPRVTPELGEMSDSSSVWIPRLRIPSDLYLAYSRGVEALSTRSSSDAAYDLAVLEIPPGLDRDQFTAIVGARILQQTLISELDHFLRVPRRFGEVRDHISEIAGLDREAAEDGWQTTMRWLFEFLPGRYSHNVFRHSEIVARSEVTE